MDSRPGCWWRAPQSGFHLSCGQVVATNLRFLSFVVQRVIAVYWTRRLLALLH